MHKLGKNFCFFSAAPLSEVLFGECFCNLRQTFILHKAQYFTRRNRKKEGARQRQEVLLIFFIFIAFVILFIAPLLGTLQSPTFICTIHECIFLSHASIRRRKKYEACYIEAQAVACNSIQLIYMYQNICDDDIASYFLLPALIDFHLLLRRSACFHVFFFFLFLYLMCISIATRVGSVSTREESIS